MRNLKSDPQAEVQAKEIGLYHRKIGIMFQCSALGWWPTKKCLSNYYLSVDLGNAAASATGIGARGTLICIHWLALAK